MSVLIKGIKKPKRCSGFDGHKCPFLDDEDNCVLQEPVDGTWDDLYANCPLVELPEKHGRLIDADALVPDICHDWNGWRVPSDDYSEECIRKAPTIIEAEGEQ